MKVGVLSESPADEAAVRILVDGVLGEQTELVPTPSLRTRGWASVLADLPKTMNHLHYHTEAEALIVVLDSDDSLPHQQAHDVLKGAHESCRLCRLRAVAIQVKNNFRDIQGKARFKTAIVLAVPAIEAWYRCGLDPHAIEAALIHRIDAGTRALKNQLKLDAYGTDRPSEEMRLRVATEEARRLVQELDNFERLFPGGFGALLRDIRNW